MKNFNLNSVTLTNYKLHDNLTVDFKDGITVITGDTSTGKSCVFDAVKWVYGFSDISQKDFRKEGTDVTSVTIKLQSGFDVERVRSNSLNRYILRKEGCEDKIFDLVGKDVPEEIRTVLGISELEFDKTKLAVNFSDQDDLNFIFDSKIPASFNAKLFNKLTGNELLDSLFQSCNREGLSINKDIKSLNDNIIKLEESFETHVKEYNTHCKTLQEVVEIYTKIEEKINIYEELNKLANKLKENKESSDFVKFKLDKIIIISDSTIKDLEDKANKLEAIINIKRKLDLIDVELLKLSEKQKLIKTPNIDLDSFEQKAEMCYSLEQLSNKLKQNKENQDKVKTQIKIKEDLIIELSKKLKEVWSELAFCDKCKPIAENVLFGDK